jgi:DNA (cytosine-5)-methyltransferase 1
VNFVDLFAGIGGFRLGMEANGHKCVGWCEKDRFAQKSYRAIHNTKGEWFSDDITTVRPDELPEFDVLCGGFPCQAFSIAGNREGFEDTRGTLFFEIARIIKKRRPKIVFLENVQGLLNHDEGRTFATILFAFSDLRYDVQWQVLNSKDFGVPQNRERVFIIASPREERTPKVFPIRRKTEGSIKRIQGDISGKGYGSQQDRVYKTNGLMCCLPSSRTKSKVKILEPAKVEKVGNVNPSGRGQNWNVYHSQGLSPTVTTNKGEGHKIYEPRACLTPDRINKRQNGRRFKEPGEPSFTLTKQDKHGIEYKGRIRRLTPKECWRLQGFPDWAFEKAQEVNSDSQLYRQAGNSVTVPVIYEIAKKLEEVDGH